MAAPQLESEGSAEGQIRYMRGTELERGQEGREVVPERARGSDHVTVGKLDRPPIALRLRLALARRSHVT
jgi:hypothetical protein